jgi:hypothetical protein
MVNKREIDGFVETGTYAAEKTRAMLLSTEMRKPTEWAKATLLNERAETAREHIEWLAAEKEKERLAAEAHARAVAAAAETRARIERTKEIAQRLGIGVFQIYLWGNLIFGIYQGLHWSNSVLKSLNAAPIFSISIAEFSRSLVSTFTTLTMIVAIWTRYRRAIEFAIGVLLFHVVIAMAMVVYYDSLRLVPTALTETWIPSVVAIVVWIPVLSGLRSRWERSCPIPPPTPTIALKRDPTATCTAQPAVKLPVLSWQAVTLLGIAMVCVTAFAIAWLGFRGR